MIDFSVLCTEEREEVKCPEEKAPGALKPAPADGQPAHGSTCGQRPGRPCCRRLNQAGASKCRCHCQA